MAISNLPGVYETHRKDGTIYYRASITYRNKHISLGSFCDAYQAGRAYEEAGKIISDTSIHINDYASDSLSFEKWVVLCNFRDNGIYISNPIYVRPNFFYYYFKKDDFFIFSSEDLFYYSAHKIQRRGGHYFVADYGSQINILGRYGIKNHAVLGKDYEFINGNHQDMQYSNIHILNSYHGVSVDASHSSHRFLAKIHVNGYIIIGRYSSAIEAAIAYNKAADILIEAGISKQFPTNYIDGLSAMAYADLYTTISVSPKISQFTLSK